MLDILVVPEAMGMKLILEDQGPQFPEPLKTGLISISCTYPIRSASSGT